MHNQSTKNQTYYWYILIFILLIFGSIRYRLLGIPLERDEGEFAYIAQLMLQGIPPYAEAYTMKFPGTSLMYALFISVFGESIHGIHWGLLLVNLSTIVLIFVLYKKLFHPLIAIISCTVYGMLSLGTTVLGFAAHATHFVILFALAGIFILIKSLETKKIFHLLQSGLFFGIAIMMKQQGVFFLLFGLCYLVYSERAEKNFSLKIIFQRMSWFLIAALFPFILTIPVMLYAGVFSPFWFWTIEYVQKYATHYSLAEGMENLKNMINDLTDGYLVLWILALTGFLLQFWMVLDKKKLVFINLLLFISSAAVCMGFYFRHHYFILVLPVISLLAALCFEFLRLLMRKNQFALIVPVFLFLLISAKIFIEQKEYYFKTPLLQLSRNIYNANPFAESLTLAEFIKQNTRPDERIAILGSEPQLLFYSKRKSATPYIYTYDMVTSQKKNEEMQNEMIANIENVKPSLILFVNIYGSWMMTSATPKIIFEWANHYLYTHYKQVLISDMVDTDKTIYKYDQEAENYIPPPTTLGNIIVYQRVK